MLAVMFRIPFVMLVTCVDFFVSLLFIFNVTAFDFKFHQHDYKLTFEWGELIRYNHEIVKKGEIHVFKYNRTTTAGNLTVEYNIDLGNELELVVQAYKFASNEYRLFPIRVQVNFCEAVDKNLVGAKQSLTCGNFTGCPIKKRVKYHICNWAPEPGQFPPFIPNGRYKLEFQGLYRGTEVGFGNAYGEVSRPIISKK